MNSTMDLPIATILMVRMSIILILKNTSQSKPGKVVCLHPLYKEQFYYVDQLGKNTMQHCTVTACINVCTTNMDSCIQ